MRFGLLGTGPWAEMVHGPVLAAHEEVELVGVWGRRPERAASLAGRLGAAVYEDPRALFSAVDAVSFALAPNVQAQLAPEAARAGCHLLLEKPLALDLAGAEAVVAAVEKAGVSSLVFYTALFDPVLRDFFGEVSAHSWTTANVVMLRSIFEGDSPFGASPWRRERGALWDVGPHALSWAAAGLGAVAEARGVRGPGDLVHLTARHDSGATSSHILSLTAPKAAASRSATFFGESGVLSMPERRSEAPLAFAGAVHELIEAARRPQHRHPLDAQQGLELVRALAMAEAG